MVIRGGFIASQLPRKSLRHLDHYLWEALNQTKKMHYVRF
jgi:hypothetical protein